MFSKLADLLKKLVQLAQERNLLALESLSELRDANKKLCQIERNQETQIELLKEIAAALAPSAPGPAASLVLTLGKATPQ